MLDDKENPPKKRETGRQGIRKMFFVSFLDRETRDWQLERQTSRRLRPEERRASACIRTPV